MESLEQLIRRSVPLGKASNSGFHSLKCPICNDYKHRLGIKFDAGNVIANCFNCAFKAVYESTATRLSRHMRKLLTALGVEGVDIEKFEGSQFLESKMAVPTTISVESLTKKTFSTAVQPLPEGSVLIENSDDESALDIAEYLHKRKILDTGYSFYVAPKTYPRRVIIPFYRGGKIIYWQARAIDDNVQPRYIGCNAPKEAMIFNYDALYQYHNKPLFVVEGVFDALNIDGISLIGSTINETKIDILKTCRRPLVFVLDPDKNGRALGEKILDLGWAVTFTPDGSDDVNDAVRKYGKLYTVYSLMQNIRTNSFITKVEIAMKCRGGKHN